MCDDPYNELQQGGVRIDDDLDVIRSGLFSRSLSDGWGFRHTKNLRSKAIVS